MNLHKYLFLVLLLVFAGTGSFARTEMSSRVQSPDKTLRFAFITDIHYSEGAHSIADLRDCIRDINSQDSLDFVVVGGDLTDFGTDEEIASVKEILDSLRYKYYVVAGNHDAKWSESGCNTFLKVFGYEHFEFESGGWRFLGCNCGPDMRMAPALIPEESICWLRGLKAVRKSIFFNHYPQDTSVLNYFEVTRELKRLGVEFVIGGHWHKNTVLNYEGLPAVLGRSSLSGENAAGYNIFVLDQDHVSVSERRVLGSTTVQFEPWYTSSLASVKDTVTYDRDGLPSSFPWMRYDINRRYPQVQEIWTIHDTSNIVSGFATSIVRRVKRHIFRRPEIKEVKVVYYTTTSGCVKAVTGKETLWSSKLGGKIFSTPAVSGDRLVSGCADGYIYAMDPSDGRVVWKVKARKAVLGSPVIFDGKVFIGASDGCFRALDLKDGSVVWTYSQVEGFVECAPYVDSSQVVFGTWGDRLYSLDTKTGGLQWVWNSGRSSRMYSPAACWCVKSDGRIFFALPDRKVYVLDAHTGKELFKVDGGRESVGISEDGSTIYAKTMYNSAYAFKSDVSVDKVRDGLLPVEAQDWNVADSTGYDISPSSIAEIAGVVLIPTDKGNLIALSASDGHFLWAHKISIALVNPLSVWVDGEKIFILASTMDGVVQLMSAPVNNLQNINYIN